MVVDFYVKDIKSMQIILIILHRFTKRIKKKTKNKIIIVKIQK